MIETSSALAEFVARIGETDRVGVDTEADSLHCYREKVCLVQIGLPGADELVDPLAGLDLSPLLDSLSHTEMVMHGADFDLRMLYRLGLGAPSRVFDTMIAARVVRERDPQTEWRVRGSHTLGPRASAILRALWHWREKEAQDVDRPPFHILSNEKLVDAAQCFDRAETVSPRGMSSDRRARFVRAAETASRLDPSEWPGRVPARARIRLTRDQDRRLAALRQRRNGVAAALAVDADLVAPRAALERIAVEGDGGLGVLLPWQQHLLSIGR